MVLGGHGYFLTNCKQDTDMLMGDNPSKGYSYPYFFARAQMERPQASTCQVYFQIRYVQGFRRFFSPSPQKAAEFLANSMGWFLFFPPQACRENIPLRNGSYVADESPFALADFACVCRRTKSLKAYCHEGVPGELFRWLHRECHV